MEDRYESEVCLIQIATNAGVTIVDPFLDLDVSEFWGLVADEEIESVVHAGQEDLALCVQHTGQAPRNIFDAQIAAGLVGADYPLSLQKLVQQFAHVRLHKSKTLTDWRRRPLTQAQIDYAAEDVAYLLRIHAKLHTKLSKRKRVVWAREEFQRFEELTLYRQVVEEKLARVKGAGALTGKHLAVLHELLGWRDERAQRLNRPARVVLKDYLLVEVARHAFTNPDEVRDLRGINLNERDSKALCRAVTRGLETPPEKWPVGKKSDFDTPQDSTLIALATAVARSYCLDHDISHSLAATKRSMGQLVRYRRKNAPLGNDVPTLLRGWRGQTVGKLLDEVLAGERNVFVDHTDGSASIRVVKRRH